jgi:hypothetical protein
MKDRKLQQLFAAAREETPPLPPEDFAAQVTAALPRKQWESASISLWDQLGQLLPRLAFAVVIIIGLCLVAEFYSSTVDASSLSAEVNQLSEQWLFAVNGN